jgi:predicted lipoprotein with Yx(FWY)xxD motif
MKKTYLIAVLIGALIIVAGIAFYTRTGSPRQDEEGQTDQAIGPGTALVKKQTDAKIGEYLTDENGRTLYIYAEDGFLISNCTDACSKKYPPYSFGTKGVDVSRYKDQFSSKINLLKRSDDAIQLAYGDRPLYYYSGDTKPGDINGQAAKDGWAIARP